jgi:methyl coenzyme M reductase subunit D
MTENKIKIIKKSVTGKDEKGRSLMIVEDESIKNQKRFNTAIAPKDFHAKVGAYISKTREVNYVKSHMEDINEVEKMYSYLLKESK